MRSFLAAVLSLACVGASAAGFVPEAGEQGRLELVFDEPITIWQNDASRLVTLDGVPVPACHWSDDRRLACTAPELLEPAHRYRVAVAAGLATQRGERLPAIAREVETARPALSARVDWHAAPVLEVRANMALDAESLRRHVVVKLGTRRLAPEWRRAAPQWTGDTRERWQWAVPTPSRHDAVMTVQLRAGLRSPRGPLRGREAALLQAVLRPSFALQGVRCGSRDSASFPARRGRVQALCPAGESIALVFTAPLDEPSRRRVEAAWRAAVSNPDAAFAPGAITPLSRGEGWTHPPTWGLITTVPTADTDAVLVLDDTLRSTAGDTLAPVRAVVRAGSAAPQLLAPAMSALLADPAADVPLLQAINLGRVRGRLETAAQEPADARVDWRGPATGSKTLDIPLPAATRALRDGGWARFSYEGAAEPYAAPGVLAAAPAFSLAAVAGRREMVVWANEWDSAAPVPGAHVSLWWRDGDDAPARRIAQADADAEGVARLMLPDEISIDADEPPQARWWVRASVGTRHATLPPESATRLGTRAAVEAWGITDRPMYHAGETVHWRLWRREIRGGAVHTPHDAAPVALFLQDEGNRQTLREWQAVPARDGSLMGETTIPIEATDGTHCIGTRAGEYASTTGACFFVGTYRPPDLWASVTPRATRRVLREGDRLRAAFEAGWFSGGPAAGVALSDIQANVYGLAIENEYPRWSQYHFAAVYADHLDEPSVAGIASSVALDAAGRYELDVPLDFETRAKIPVPFGTVVIEGRVGADGREDTLATDQSLRYAAHERYVGLQVTPRWFDAREVPSFEAVVVTAEGEAVPATPIDAEIWWMGHHDDAPRRVGACPLAAGVASACDFPRERSGTYRITAHAPGAASTQLDTFVWLGEQPLPAKEAEPLLEIVDASPARDRPARARLSNVPACGRALVLLSSDGEMLDRQVVPIAQPTLDIALPLQAAWRNELAVDVLTHPCQPSTREGVYRVPRDTHHLQATILEAPITPGAPVTLAFEPARSAPGSMARLVLRNTGDAARRVAVSVMDDALRAQAGQWLPYADPAGPAWLQGGARRGHSLAWSGFADWRVDALRWFVPQQGAAQRDGFGGGDGGFFDDEGSELDRIEVTGSRITRADIVENHESVGKEAAARRRTAGGDGGDAGPSVRTRFADTAYWNADIALAAGESRTLEVSLPDNLTRWRAVAWSAGEGEDFAMTDAVLEAGLPVEARLQAPVRLYPGDRSELAANARHQADVPAVAELVVQVDERGSPREHVARVDLAPGGQGGKYTTLAPDAPGEVALIARAAMPAGRDAVAARVDVASPTIAARRVQAGWLGEHALQLPLPTLPEGAMSPTLKVSVLRGAGGFADGWYADLRDYPHRCWEQMLSRAVGAALALEQAPERWPGAREVVREALDNAGVFQSGGGMRHFAGENGTSVHTGLTEYTVRAFALLRELGHAVPDHVDLAARDYLQSQAARTQSGFEATPIELALGARAGGAAAPPLLLDRLWQGWDRLPLAGRTATAAAMQATTHPRARAALQRVLEAAPLHDGVRRVQLAQRGDAWMSSALREQCTLIELVRKAPRHVPAGTLRELFAGLADLYAGGAPSTDTQSAATCLMALHEAESVSTPVHVEATLGTASHTLQLPAGQRTASWDAGVPTGATLGLGPAETEVPLSFVARLDFQEDARQARALAAGLAIERRYEVFADGAWEALTTQKARTGDWIRITLQITTAAERRFVALTDDVPGGLQPTDLALGALAGERLEALSSEGSHAFRTRRLDARKPRFYAESLSPGVHLVHYFARVGNAGRYLAAPATAELMYGEAASAHTAADEVELAQAPR